MEANATKEIKKREQVRMEKPKKKSRHIVRKIILILLLLIVIAGLGLYLYQSIKAEYTVTYQPYTASIGTISNSMSFNGTLQAVHNTTYTAESSGTVRTVYVKAGDQVHDGDRLLRLSTGQVVEAEFDGEVNVMNFEAGESVLTGDALCQVVDFKHMKTTIRVDEYDINDVHVGDAIRITTTANEKVFDSTIAAINHTSSSTGNVAYYTATAYLDVDSEVFPGMQVTVTLPKEEAADVVVLKMDAISFDEMNIAFVYTMNENEEMQRTYITTGVSNGSYAEIKSGLNGGDTVYTEVKTEAASGFAGMMSSMFGNRRIMGTPGMGGGNNRYGGSYGNFGGFGGNPGNFGGGAGGFGGNSGGRSGGSGSGSRNGSGSSR